MTHDGCTYRVETHGEGGVGQDGDEDVAGGRVAAEVGDDHRESGEQEARHPGR